MRTSLRCRGRHYVGLRVVFCGALCGSLFVGETSRAAEGSKSPEHTNAASGKVHPGTVGKLPDLEAALHGFPAFLDSQGKKIADGEFIQWVDGQQLRVRITYDFGAGHQIEEQATFRQEPEFVQDSWTWKELRNEHLYRQFSVDLGSGKAAGKRVESGGAGDWSKDLRIEPGRTFAGFGFTLALKGLRERLIKGQKIELLAVIFSPTPRIIPVDISYGGRDRLFMAGRTVPGDRFVVHPKVPLIARAFVDVRDEKIWLTLPRPAGFLRWEGNIVEPDDPIVRVDLLPGERSGVAEPDTSPGGENLTR